jgi:hypothetical protein
MELNIGINLLIDTLNIDNDVLIFYTILRLCFKLIKRLCTLCLLFCVGGGKM